MPTRPSLAAIPSLEPVVFSGPVYRVVPEALGDRILSTEGNRYYPGRWHAAGESGVLYTSLEAGVALRELGRHASRDRIEGGLVTGTIEIRLQKVLDLTADAALGALGLSREALIPADHSMTQAISLQARKAGFQGLMVPSATGTGANLIVFENNLSAGCRIEVRGIEPSEG